MRALRVERHGEPADVLVLRDIPSPEPKPGEVRVRVGAAALNWPDVNLCRGIYHLKPPLPFTPGMEAAGVVTAVGEGVDSALIGTRVVSGPVLPDGALAEETIMKAARLLEVPDGVDDGAAAAMLIAFTTAHVSLYRRGNLQPDETLVVHAAAGGVGSAAVQMGRVIGARVIAVAGGQAKKDVCLSMGADVFIDSLTEDVKERVLEETGGKGADVIFDPVGGEAFEQSRRSVNVDGRILIVGFASGEIPKVSVNSVLYRGYSVVGVYMGAYNRGPEDIAFRAKVYAEINDLLMAGKIHPVIAQDVQLEDAPRALDDLIARRVVGKVIVRP